MPDETLSARLKELRTIYPPNAREVLTLELRQRPVDVYDELDIVLVVDLTATMGAMKTVLADMLTGLVPLLAVTYSSVKMALVTFKDELETSVVLNFTNVLGVQSILSGLTVSGGGDSADNGYGAIRKAAELEWRQDAARVVLLWTDSTSHSRGTSYQRAKMALNFEDVFFCYGGGTTFAAYDSLATTTGGTHLTATTSAALQTQFKNVLLDLANPVEDPIYLVRDNANFTATLETGATKTFQRRLFALDPFTTGDDGAVGIPLTVDNTDLAVSRYIAKAKQFQHPLDVTVRIFDSTDPSAPLNNPPLRLFASDFETSGSVVSCRLTTIELTNATFPDADYSPERCPSLQ